MEKNCTNCKFNIPVYDSTYTGICNNNFQKGQITSEHMVCSKHEVKEFPTKDLKNTIDNMQETIEGLKCCTSGADGCKTCPFARYGCTCKFDLMFSAQQLLVKQRVFIEALERMFDEYATVPILGKQRALMVDRPEVEG